MGGVAMSQIEQERTTAKGTAPHPGARAGEPDHFAVLGIERAWHLDAALLAERHLALSRELHPDRFAQASPRERLLSLERTTALNNAYRTLRDPILRAEYILRQEGIGKSGPDPAGDSGPGEVDAAFLEEIMHVRERMLELGLGGGRGRQQAAGIAIRAEAEAKISEIDRRIDDQFSAWEQQPAAARSRTFLLEIDRCLARRRYYANIVREIDGEDVPSGHGAL